jgi:hypothetical protein
VQAKALFQLLNILLLLVEVGAVGTLVEAVELADIEPHYRLQFQGRFWLPSAEAVQAQPVHRFVVQTESTAFCRRLLAREVVVQEVDLGLELERVTQVDREAVQVLMPYLVVQETHHPLPHRREIMVDQPAHQVLHLEAVVRPARVEMVQVDRVPRLELGERDQRTRSRARQSVMQAEAEAVHGWVLADRHHRVVAQVETLAQLDQTLRQPTLEPVEVEQVHQARLLQEMGRLELSSLHILIHSKH